MKIKIRTGTKKDLSSYLSLADLYHEEAAADPNFGDYVSLKRPSRKKFKHWFGKLMEEVRKGNALYAVADTGSGIAGHCFVRKDEPGSELDHLGRLSIFVSKNHRGSGIGTKLIKYALEKCKRNYRIIYLFVFKSNEKAIRLYKRMGFRSVGVIPEAYKRGKRYIDREYMYIKLK